MAPSMAATVSLMTATLWSCRLPSFFSAARRPTPRTLPSAPLTDTSLSKWRTLPSRSGRIWQGKEKQNPMRPDLSAMGAISSARRS